MGSLGAERTLELTPSGRPVEGQFTAYVYTAIREGRYVDAVRVLEREQQARATLRSPRRRTQVKPTGAAAEAARGPVRATAAAARVPSSAAPASAPVRAAARPPGTPRSRRRRPLRRATRTVGQCCRCSGGATTTWRTSTLLLPREQTRPPAAFSSRRVSTAAAAPAPRAGMAAWSPSCPTRCSTSCTTRRRCSKCACLSPAATARELRGVPCRTPPT